jgi:sugar phosphate permease
MGKIHWAWFVLTACFVTVFTNYSIRLSYNILMPEMIASLKITKTEAGAIASFFYFAYTLFSPLVGFLIDRYSARKIIVVFCLILAGGTFCMGRPTSFLQACLFFMIVGIGSAAMWTPIVTLVQRWFTLRRRGMALGILSISYAIGYGLMGLILPPLVDRFDWRACWLFLAGLALMLVPLNGFLLRSRPGDIHLLPWGEKFREREKNVATGNGKRIRYGQLLRMANLWWVGVSYFFVGITAYIVNIFIVTYGTMELRFPFAQAAKLASAIAFSGILGALFLPLLSDFIGRKKCLILINLSLSGSIGLIILAGNQWGTMLLTVSIFGVFYAAVWPLYGAAAGDFFPSGMTGSVLGFWTIFYGLGLVLAPMLGGYIADLTGTFRWSFLVAVGTGILSAFFFSRIHPVEKSVGAE